jgi:hypothetical protein
MTLDGETRIRAMVTRHPSTLRVLTGHGWAGCGGPSGPDETLEFFARAHQIPLASLLGELEEEIQSPGPEPQPQTQVQRQSPPSGPALVVAYAIVGLVATLTAGSILGAINLLRIQVLLTGASTDLLRLHAAYQLNGLMAAFICGVALHVLPRFWSVAPARRTVSLSLLGLIAGALAVRAGALAAGPSGHAWVSVAGALTVAAGVVFSCWAWMCRLASPRPTTGLDALLVAGATWWPVGAALWLAGEWPWRDGVLLPLGVAAGQEAILHGFVLSWIVGMGPRVLPFFTRLGHPRSRAAWVIALVLTAGVALRSLGLAVSPPFTIAAAGRLVVAVALLGFTLSIDLPDSRQLPIYGTTGAFRHAVVMSIVWCAAGALVYLTAALRDIGGFGPAHSLALDAARHSLAVGFGVGLLVAVSSRLIPTFTDTRLPYPRLLNAGLAIFHAGVAARWAQAAATLGVPSLLAASGVSGLIVVAGLVPWVVNLVALSWTLRRTGQPAQPVGAGSRISEVLSSRPDAIQIMVRLGFKQLANPAIRASLAHLVTLDAACRLHGIPVERVLEALLPDGEASGPAAKPLGGEHRVEEEV